MSTPSYYQTLLNPTKTIKPHKIILFFFTVGTLLIALVYVGLVTIQPNKSNLNNELSLSDKSHDRASVLAFINKEFPNEVKTMSSKSYGDRKMLWKMLSTHSLDINKVIYKTKRSNVQITRVQAVEDCLELMDLSRDRVEDSIKALANYMSKYNYRNANDDDNNIRTWLSAVLTNHVTCLDQLEDYSPLLGLKSMVEDLISKGRVALSIHAKISSKENFKQNFKKSRYPSWLGKRDRKLLQVSGNNIEANIVVAKDGSGNFTTVGEALVSVPDKGKERYVIYVKEGVYEENVEVGKKKKNVMIVGDGMNLTILTGSQNVVDGNTTFKSREVANWPKGLVVSAIESNHFQYEQFSPTCYN